MKPVIQKTHVIYHYNPTTGEYRMSGAVLAELQRGAAETARKKLADKTEPRCRRCGGTHDGSCSEQW